MTLVLFEDEGMPQLDPVAVGKPGFAIRCGSYHLVDLLGALGRPMRCVVRPHLRALVEADFSSLQALGSPPGTVSSQSPLLFVNARLVPSVAVLRQLESLLAGGRSGLVRAGKSIAAALFTT